MPVFSDSTRRPPVARRRIPPALGLGAIILAIVLTSTASATPARGCARGATPCAASSARLGARVALSAMVFPESSVVSEESIDEGRKIFHGRGTCFTCHGGSLEGGPIAPTLRDHPWKDAKGGSIDAIYQVVTHGVPGTVMVSHPGGISDADAHRVASYIWAVSHGHARP